MWEGSQKVDYIDSEQAKKSYSELLEEYEGLLTKLESISKLLEQILNILLSYNPKLAEQTKEQLDKINEQTDNKEPKS
tara:strand:+ start:123 stop:356 length:234 start_codon:yes stop_codon:yes gene_type:complete